MRVAMAVYSHYSRDARVRRYAQALAEKNINVDIVCLKEDYQPKEKNISLIFYPIPRRRLGRLWNIIEYLLFFIFSFILITYKYFFVKYKIIHIHNMPDILVFTAIIPKLFGAKVILDMHDPMPELYMSKYHVGQSSIVVKILRLLEKLSFNFADKVITANEEFKKIFLSRHKTDVSRISVILNCPDPEIFNPQLIIHNLQHFTLLYMGTVEERFGLDIAVEAMPELIKKIRNIRFVIIPKLEDEGEYFKNLESRIKNSELRNFIQILSPRPLEEIAQELKKADIGIVLAKNGVFTDNIFPVKLLEFIQMNVPVIATRTKVLPKFFDEKSLYFLPCNTSGDFSDAVITLFNSPSLQKSLVKNASIYLKKYNWEKEKQKYYNLINPC